MAEEAQEEKKGGKGLIITLIAVVVLLVVGIGVMAALLLMSGDKAESNGADQPPQIQYSAQYKQYPAPGPDDQPQYFEMKFVVNFQGEGRARFLAVDLNIMSRYPGVVDDMEHIRPILKNDISQLLGDKTYTELNAPGGREALRLEILEVVRAAADQNRIFPELVENVFLTRFVMQ